MVATWSDVRQHPGSVLGIEPESSGFLASMTVFGFRLRLTQQGTSPKPAAVLTQAAGGVPDSPGVDGGTTRRRNPSRRQPQGMSRRVVRSG
jgi:hypothetical protein